jgi:phosphoribosylglycinamide formyltransferase 1
VVDAGLPAEEAEARLLELLEESGAEIVVLAGYLRLVPPGVVRRFPGKILNIHPALLPAFGGKGMYGMRVHEAVLASGARVSGATVHLVDDVYDRGKIVAQWPVPVLPGDTPEKLAARVLAVEHRLLPAVISCLAGPSRRTAAAGEMAFELVESAAPGETGLRGWIQLCDAREG